MELYKTCRPKKLEDVVGHDAEIKSLQQHVAKRTIPHAILLSGPFGIGKTTIGRILRQHVGCHSSDFVEMNCAKYRGIDQMRPIEQQASQMPLQGRSRMWLMDECHMLTREAANCLLKILEDTPPHSYFVLATTEPQKVIGTIRSRCQKFNLSPLSDRALGLMIRGAAKKVGIKISSNTVKEIIENSEGSGRDAMVLLDKIRHMDDDDDILSAIRSSSDKKKEVYELCRMLMFRKSDWRDVVKMLKGLDKEDPEGIRRLMLACSKTAMLGSNSFVAKRGYLVAEACRDNYFDCGMAGLVASCWQVFFGD
jgi:DNA polymerase III gamma/tau subunit